MTTAIPLSMHVELSVHIPADLAIQHLDVFIAQSEGGLADQTTTASLLRLQQGIRDELTRQQTVNTEVKQRSVSPSQSRKRKKHEIVADDGKIIDIGSLSPEKEDVSQLPQSDADATSVVKPPKKKKAKKDKAATS